MIKYQEITDILLVTDMIEKPTSKLARFTTAVGGLTPSRTGGRIQGSRIRSVRILFFERYVRRPTLMYSILAYVDKNITRCNYNIVF